MQCPNCGQALRGLYNQIPERRRKWYGSSHVKACARCGTALRWNSASRLWLLGNLIPLGVYLSSVSFDTAIPKHIWLMSILIAIAGDVVFLKTRVLVRAGAIRSGHAE